MSVEVKASSGPVEFKDATLFRVIDGALFAYSDSNSDAIGCVAAGQWSSVAIAKPVACQCGGKICGPNANDPASDVTFAEHPRQDNLE